VVSPADLKRFYTVNGIFPGAVLVDGFAAGLWRLARARKTATLTIELFAPGGPREEIAAEAERMLQAFAPDASPDLRFAQAG
jgi:hypothetical protein